MNCRFIDAGFNNAYTNMQIDESLLKNSKGIVLRFYQWKPKAVSIGYNQDEKEINLDYCKKNKIDIVRRITGGKAVFHDNELTYSFACPENLLHKDINESFRQVAEALISGLKKLGIKAEIKRAPDRIKTPICFNSANWYEILVNGKKISGSAQRRMNNRILQHGSILLDFDYEVNSKIFRTRNEEQTLKELKDRITSIKKELSANDKIPMKNNSLELKKLAEALKQGFEERFDIKLGDSTEEKEILPAKTI